MPKAMPTLIKRYIDAYNAGDVDRMLACLSQDIRFTNITGGKVTAEASGSADFRTMAETALRSFSRRHQEITNVITVDEVTLAEISYSATPALDLPNGWKAGSGVSLNGASLFEVKDGLIARLTDQS
ncbi:nuclear transport factor 2 family protein [uncultured Roseibium sp.]|uniref:nuclear transport factor 2 family protein n=1 Tax=uncultured Roseibium sp. TaxID=1936171 RepID=UPI00260D4A47|nr:nuclear transport factor 2 family protein [uncultured Roseibium sp.]